MTRTGGSFRLYRGEKCLTSGMLDFSRKVTAEDVARAAGASVKALLRMTPVQLAGCVLVVTGPFAGGLARFDIVVEDGQTKLRRQRDATERR